MLRLLGVSLGLWAALALLIAGAQIVGQRQPPARGVARFHLTECAPPCWIGIVPGTTTISAAKARLIATFGGQSGLQIRDSGFADGNVLPNAVENTITGDNFSLLVRLNIADLVDGKNEIVQSIGLFEARGERSDDAPTLADILAVFGAPQEFASEETLGLGREITLRYDGFDVVYFTRMDRPPLAEIPRLYLGSGSAGAEIPASDFHPWTWYNVFAAN